MADSPLPLGKIGYLNVLPIYHPLETGKVPADFEIVTGPPAALNERMAAGRLPLSAVSSIEYARRPERYFLVPDIAIGSRGPVQSVLLLSKQPPESLGGAAVLVSSQTHTSAALLRLLLEERYGLRDVRYIVGEASEGVKTMDAAKSIGAMGGKRSATDGGHDAPAAILAIGDEALALRRHPAYPLQLDLGEAWRVWTGLPFIFGLWAVSREAYAAAPTRLAEACRTLLAAKRHGIARLPALYPLAALASGLSREEIASYFAGLVYDLGPLEQAGLRAFYAALARHGLVESAPELAFVPL